MVTALVRAGGVAQAFAQWSHWVAGCWRCPSGAPLQRFQPILECGFCGATTEIMWPTERMVEGVERLLMMRPDPSTRNWNVNESLHDLMFENGAHGVFDSVPDDGPGISLFAVNDHGIQVDKLPVLEHRTRRGISDGVEHATDIRGR